MKNKRNRLSQETKNNLEEIFSKNSKDYQILDELGKGGFGTVFKARQKSTGQIVALKMLHLNSDENDQDYRRKTERFERETQLCAELHHPNIVRLLDKGQTEDNRVYIIFEYVPGKTLKEVIMSEGAMSAADAGELMSQVLDALACAHRNGVVHRDLKPHNIMVTSTGAKPQAKVLDFGIGTIIPQIRGNDFLTITLTQEALGTPSYSAPEQLRGEPITVQADIYAWGLLFLECLTGEPVMNGSSTAEIFHKQLNPQEVSLPPAIVGHPLAAILRRALKKKPRERCKDAEQLWNDLKKVHLGDLVGSLQKNSGMLADNQDQPTEVSNTAFNEKRQITVLCCRISLSPSLGSSNQNMEEAELDIEMLEELQRDQFNQCIDLAIRFGGTIAGTLGDRMMVYFGFPHASDTDARRAARTALELNSLAQKRRPKLKEQHGVHLQIKTAIHTGTVLVSNNEIPSGYTANIALRLSDETEPDSILVSEASFKRLEKHILFEENKIRYLNGGSIGLKTYFLKKEQITESINFFPAAATDRPMIGRDEELRLLLQIWKRAVQSNGEFVLLSGETGIGKSRMVRETRLAVREEGYQSYECQCLPEYENNALFPILSLMRQKLGMSQLNPDLEDLRKLEKELKRIGCDLPKVMPVFCSWFSLPFSDYPVSTLPPSLQKEILLGSIVEWIVFQTNEAPLLLVLEDIHWVDPTTLELIEKLLSQIKKRPLMFLVVARPEFQPPWPENAMEWVRLQGLSKDSAASMIYKVMGQMKPDQEVLEKIVERTDGIPLFIEELSRMMMETQLVESKGKWHLKEHVRIDDIPLTLKDSLIGRLDRLAGARETVQLASTLGREFDYKILSSVSYKDEGGLRQDLEDLVDSGLVVRQRQVGDSCYIFRHALIRDTAYDCMLASDREETHLRIATTLESEFPEVVRERPEEIARHFASGKSYDQSVNYGIQATKASLERSANQETSSLGKQTLEWNQKRKENKEKLQTELTLNGLIYPAVMAIVGFGSKELLQITNRNAELKEKLASSIQSPSSIQESEPANYLNQWVEFTNSVYLEENDKAIFLGEKIIAECQKKGDRVREMLACPILATAYFMTGQLEKTKKQLVTALELYNGDQDLSLWKEFGVEAKSLSLSLMGMAEAFLGFPSKGEKLCLDAADWAKKAGCTMFIDASFVNKAVISFVCSEPQKILEQEKHFFQQQRDTNDVDWMKAGYQAIHDWAVGKQEHAQSYILENRKMLRTGALAWLEVALAETMISQGNLEKAILFLQELFVRVKEKKSNWIIPLIEKDFIRAFYRQNHKLTTEIEEHFQRGRAEAEEQKAKLSELLLVYEYCSILKNEGRTEESKALLFPLLNSFPGETHIPLFQKAKELLNLS